MKPIILVAALGLAAPMAQAQVANTPDIAAALRKLLAAPARVAFTCWPRSSMCRRTRATSERSFTSRNMSCR